MNNADSKYAWVALAVILAAATIGCDDGVLTDRDDVVYLTPFGDAQVQAVEYRDSPPRLSPREEANFDEVMTSFEEQADELLERPGVEQILGPIEQSFLFTGNYMTLVDIYRDHFERHGIDSIAAVALAWTHIQLGNTPEYVELERQLIEARPDDALTWLIVGEANFRQATQSVDAGIRAREAFERVLELDPDFPGFKTLERQRLDEQLRWLQQTMPDEAVESSEDDVDAPMHHTDDQAATSTTREDDIDPDEAQLRRQRRQIVDRAEKLASEAVEYAPSIADEIADARRKAQRQDGGDPQAEGPERRAAKAVEQVLRGQRALQQGGRQLAQARQSFEQALEYDSENVDAQIGMLRVDYRQQVSSEELTRRVDQIAEGPLNAEQAYDLGLFCKRSLNDPDRATSLLERVEQKDPSFARRVGVDSLLDE